MLHFLQSIIPFYQVYLGNNQWLSSIWSSLIILFFVWWFIRFLGRYKACSKTLTGVNTTLVKFSDKIPEGFEEFNEEMLAKERDVSHLWSEFNETLVKFKGTDGGEKVYNTIDSDHFFNQNSLVIPRLNLRFYNAVPGLLTGLGILGTFIGITYGLSSLNLKPSQTPDQLIVGIRGLLYGASIAFTTSIWGIVLSIIFSTFEKHYVNKLGNAVDTLQKNIDKIFTRSTPESWLSDIYKESCQQSKELKSFNTDLATSIASALDEKLASSLTPALDKLLLAIEALNNTGATSVAEQIGKSAGEEVNKLTEVLGRLGSKLEESIERTQTIQQGMDDSLKDNMNKLTESITGYTSNLGEQTNDISNTMQGQIKALSDVLHERMEDVSDRYDTERTQINTLLQVQEENLKRLENVMEGAGLAAETFKESALPVQSATRTLQNVINEISTTQGGFLSEIKTIQGYYQEMSGSIQGTVAAMNESLESTQDSWEAYETKFGDIKEGLNDVFEKLNKGLGDYQAITSGSISKYLGALDEKLSQATGHLSGAIEELRDIIEESKE